MSKSIELKVVNNQAGELKAQTGFPVQKPDLSQLLQSENNQTLGFSAGSSSVKANENPHPALVNSNQFKGLGPDSPRPESTVNMSNEEIMKGANEAIKVPQLTLSPEFQHTHAPKPEAPAPSAMPTPAPGRVS